ncbi:MAG: phosphotransferase [Planctomyces sp.]|nr:phosphotransferase [Planctomyces sp.]
MPRDFPVLELFSRIIAVLLNRVRVNRTMRGIRDGIPVIFKKRLWYAAGVIWLGNCFLKLSESGVRMFVGADEWLEWEVHCTHLLYPDRFCTVCGQGKQICIAEVRGMSLRQLVRRNEADLSVMAAAAGEVRRVHQLPCRVFEAGWSHGDLHLDNILYDRITNRAFLIDFDTRHELRLNERRRHGDDLLVFLLELIACSDEKWFEWAMAFAEAYGESTVLQELAGRLSVPHGFAGILWSARTQGASIQKMEIRIERLRTALRQIQSVTVTQ